MEKYFAMRPIIILSFLLLLSSCSTTPEKGQISQNTLSAEHISQVNQTKQLAADNNWQEAFDAWVELAEDSDQPEQSQYYNQAALMLYRQNQTDALVNFYDDVDVNQPNSIVNKNTLLASAYFNRGKTYQSLSTLPNIEEINDNTFKEVALKTKALALLNIGKPLESVQLLIQRNSLLSHNDSQLNHNMDMIWDAIDRISENHILETLSKPQANDLRGWLELALISRRSKMLPKRLEPWLEKWQLIYPEHSATEFAKQLLNKSEEVFIKPTKIALMLPTEGKLAKVSQAIQDGFLYAYYQSNNQQPEIEIINTSSESDFKLKYRQAIEQGVDLVIGPIDKNIVDDLAENPYLDVTTLALNYANEASQTNNFFQFGLKPEDEAEQIANYALLNRKYNAAILMPNNTWGERLSKAFTQRYETLGGTVQSSGVFSSGSNDYGAAIQRLLNLDNSQARHRTINTVIGQKTEFQPRRRQDIDMIFIGANARQARIIKPQLKFHYAQDIQVYATSHISTSKKSADNDRDLNGIHYVDIPWTLKSQQIKEQRDIEQLWPTLNKTHSRLFALGIDAYRLIPQLQRLKLNPDESYSGLTGELSIDQYGRVHRSLLLATYRKGLPVEITSQVER